MLRSEKIVYRIKMSRFHIFAEVLYNCYRIFYLRPEWYSQTGEDKLISRYLPETNGVYLDIGAGLPMRGSNTYFLYKKGWKGFVVDPIGLNIQLSRLFRPRDTRLRMCIGTTIGEVDFYEFVPSIFSTTKLSVADSLVSRKVARLRSVTKMQVIPASQIAPKMLPTEPTFLSIDIEGADYEALCTIKWEVTKPRVICVEDLAHTDSKSEISELLSIHGYKLKDKTYLSSIYVHESWEEKVD